VTLRLQLLLFQLLLALAVLAMAGFVWLATSTMVDRIARVHVSHQQVEAALELDGSFNRFSEQLAELLVFGPAGRAEQGPDLASARARVVADLDRLQRIGEAELATLDDPLEREAESIEAVRSVRLRQLFTEIESATDEILRLDKAGDPRAAVDLYGSRVEALLDDELDRLIDDAVADEQEEYAQVLNAARKLARRILLGTLIGLCLTGLAATVFGVMFYRSIGPPLGRLGAAAEAVENGDLRHRVEVGRHDEIGRLSLRFNSMTDELQRQRNLLMVAQEHLEGQVVERTRELVESNRRLVVLDQQRVRFLAEASHQLRTPLTVLRGEAEVALRDRSATDHGLRESLRLIAEQARDMGHLVDDLMAVARSDREEADLKLEDVSPAALAEDVVRDARRLGGQRGIELAVTDDASGLRVQADPGRLRQALMILVDNALKYSAAPHPVNVDVRCADDGIEIRVTDRGIGIPADELPLVFEPFYRGRAVHRGAAAGTGLGLPIARRTIEQFGGTLSIDSVEGAGTTARVRLPLGSHA
jgi:signal transduction histidine kinase